MDSVVAVDGEDRSLLLPSLPSTRRDPSLHQDVAAVLFAVFDFLTLHLYPRRHPRGGSVQAVVFAAVLK
jgi:hypothetical protein